MSCVLDFYEKQKSKLELALITFHARYHVVLFLLIRVEIHSFVSVLVLREIHFLKVFYVLFWNAIHVIINTAVLN